MQPSNDPNKEMLRQRVAAHTETYLAKGGVIEILPPQEFTYRLCTVRSGAGDGDTLLLFASKRDAITGKRDPMRITSRKDGAI